MSTAVEALNEADEATAADSPRRDPSPPAPLPVTLIEPKAGWRVVDVGELWRYRELLYFLTLRDIKVRYKQTILGAAWAVLQPLATMLVFSLFFGKMAGDPGSRVPYPLFVLSGLVPWMFFANAIAQAGQSVVGNQNLVSKVYFPRLIIPMGAVGAGLVDLSISFAVLLAMMAWNRVGIGWSFLLVPAITCGLVIAAMGIGTMIAALTVAYRDFRHAVPFLVQFWMFATPCIYMQNDAQIGSRLGYLLPLNPAQGLIANLRHALLGEPIGAYSLAVSLAVSVLLLLGGCLYFRRVEREFADII